jgi:hypothetical protein
VNEPFYMRGRNGRSVLYFGWKPEVRRPLSNHMCRSGLHRISFQISYENVSRNLYIFKLRCSRFKVSEKLSTFIIFYSI